MQLVVPDITDVESVTDQDVEEAILGLSKDMSPKILCASLVVVFAAYR